MIQQIWSEMVMLQFDKLGRLCTWLESGFFNSFLSAIYPARLPARDGVWRLVDISVKVVGDNAMAWGGARGRERLCQARHSFEGRHYSSWQAAPELSTRLTSRAIVKPLAREYRYRLLTLSVPLLAFSLLLAVPLTLIEHARHTNLPTPPLCTRKKTLLLFFTNHHPLTTPPTPSRTPGWDIWWWCWELHFCRGATCFAKKKK